MKKITARDVAALAGVSPATVSRALNDHPAISAKTKEAVRKACEALQYVPDLTARSLTGHRTNTIGVIIPDISNPYYSALCTAIERHAAGQGYRVMLSNTLHDPERELAAIDQMLSQQVDGLIISAYSPRSQSLHQGLVKSTPCLYVGSNHGPDCSYIEIDNESGAYEATQFLYHLGHRNMMFFGGRSGSRTLEQRLMGYRRSMRANHLPPKEVFAPDTVVGLRRWCREKASALLGENRFPGAILAYSDMMAMEVLDAAEAYGLSAPQDFSIIGFDNIILAQLPQIHLTTVTQCKSRVGRLAVERLLQRIESGGSAPRTTDVFQPELIPRSTCRKI